MTGFAATLFERNGKYVLGIRGTEPDGSPLNFGTQTSLDLIRADIAEIGLLGMSLTQCVSMVNYILRLQAPPGATDVRQFDLVRSSAAGGQPRPGAVHALKLLA